MKHANCKTRDQRRFEMDNLHIGTSGWSYDGWLGRFYPNDTEKREMLSHYTEHFGTVEINATYYRLPFENMIKGWKNRAPGDFKFAVKGHRRITHYNKLRDVSDFLAKFLERVQRLDDHLGPILWQLPPKLERDDELLADFLELLPEKYQYALEFRHKSWMDEEVYDLLGEHEVALVWISSKIMPEVCRVTAPFVYVRFHGLESGYRYNYSEGELRPWAERIAEQLDNGHQAYVYFNNDYEARGPQNAKMLRKMINEM